MAVEQFEFVRLVGEERRSGPTLSSVSRHWQGDRECFAFVSPHDDDVVLGAGLMIQLAIREKVPVHILVVTDGTMGYCSMEEKQNIAAIRFEETVNCYTKLGVPREHITMMNFPDCQLSGFRGRRLARDGDPAVIEGFVGLQNSFTAHLRRIRPTQVFVPTYSDLHPDHQIVNAELLISLFHAGGGIWPELGIPLERVPYVHELGVYCDFPTAPQLRVRTPDSYLEKKLAGIAEFKSQRQIDALIDIVRRNGPQEFLRAIEFRLYDPSRYMDRFEQKQYVPFVGAR